MPGGCKRSQRWIRQGKTRASRQLGAGGRPALNDQSRLVVPARPARVRSAVSASPSAAHCLARAAVPLAERRKPAQSAGSMHAATIRALGFGVGLAHRTHLFKGLAAVCTAVFIDGHVTLPQQLGWERHPSAPAIPELPPIVLCLSHLSSREAWFARNVRLCYTMPHAPVAQRIEHRPPEPVARVRVAPGAPLWPSCQGPALMENGSYFFCRSIDLRSLALLQRPSFRGPRSEALDHRSTQSRVRATAFFHPS
jgi:hypothetical protein